MARVLVGCECSGRVREAFRVRGHDAWSCDILPAEDGSPHHIQGNVLAVLGDGWDLGIFHPPCTYMANSGARWLFEKPERWQQLDDAAAFFNALRTAPIPRKALENPWPHRWAAERIGWPTQSRRVAERPQPWWFGDKQKKGICLWLDNLPPLVKDNDVGPPPKAGTEEAKAWEAVWRCPPGPEQKAIRARTFPGVARAFASQWGPLLPGDRAPCA